MRRWAMAAVAATVLAITGCTAETPPAPSASPTTPMPVQTDAEVFTPITGTVLAAPHATPATDGKVHLAYELVLGNALSQDVTLDAVSAMADDRALLTLEGDELSGWIRVLGGSTGNRTLGPGQQAIVWLDVVVDSLDDVPDSLTHALSITPSEDIPPLVDGPMTEMLAPTTIDEAGPVVIGAPLAGDGWLDGNSCCGVTPHRAAVSPINGALHAPERYAIDYVQLDDSGRIFDGPIDELESYAYEGADILAVGDGPVVSMVWDLPEQTPGANPSGLTVTEYGGNHIVQDLGDGRYAFYAHLQPDNPMGLAVGQELTKGETIAHLGNSGNSDAPHLHFHVMDSPLPLASNGLPFLIDDYELVGTMAPSDIDACAGQSVPCKIDTAGSGDGSGLSPLWGDVMDYPTP